jgi:hypothetical protein
MNQPNKIVAYYRVSTKIQGSSRIGLESQMRIIRQAFPNSEIIGEFEEVQSGFNNDRPKIYEAAELCRREGATLVFSDIDRASRDESFLFSTLPNLKVPYLDASAPNESQDSMLISMKKIFAGYEGRKIQGRANQTIKTRRERGDILGNAKNFTDAAMIQSKATRELQAKSNRNTMLAVGVIRLMVGKKNTEIAAYLNKYGFKTRNNSSFTHVQVGRIKEMFNI